MYCLFVCSLGKSGLHVKNFTGIFSFERSYISRLAHLVRRMNKKQSLLNCFYTFNSTLDQLKVYLNSQRFDLTTFRTLSRSVNVTEGKFEWFLLRLLTDSENAFNDFSNAVNG